MNKEPVPTVSDFFIIMLLVMVVSIVVVTLYYDGIQLYRLTN